MFAKVINNSVDSGRRGRVNGLAMGVASFFKAIGPIGGTALFAWSLTNSLSAPFDVHFCYYVMFILASGTALAAQFRLDPSLNDPIVPVMPHNDSNNDGDDSGSTNADEKETETRNLVVSMHSRAAV